MIKADKLLTKVMSFDNTDMGKINLDRFLAIKTQGSGFISASDKTIIRREKNIKGGCRVPGQQNGEDFNVSLKQS